MNSTRFLRRMFAGATGSLLLVGTVVFDSVVYGASAPQGSSVTGQLEEPLFIEISPAHRRNASLVSNFAALRSTLASRGIRMDQIWVGDTHLYLRVFLPNAAEAERNALIEQLKGHALVSKVVAAAAGSRELLNLDQLEKFDATANVPDGKLRGFREKRSNFAPDLTAPRTNEIIVKYLDAVTDTPATLAAARARIASIHAALGVRVVRTRERGDRLSEVVAVPEQAEFGAVLQAYLDSNDVEYAQPNYRYKVLNTPNDQYYSYLWGMPKISAPSAWDTRTGAPNVVVAVTDTGIDYSHPDLTANMWQNPQVGALGSHDGLYGADLVNNDNDPMDDHGYWDYVWNEDTQQYEQVWVDITHGTHVAGTIGAVGNNGIGVTGVAWSVKLMAVKVLGSDGYATTTSIEDGLEYARLKGANIVNASWGGWSTTPDLDIQTEIAALKNAGIIFVNASGNNGRDVDYPWNYQGLDYYSYPGSFGMPNMIVIDSSDSADARSYFSNYGRWSTDVFAPGSSIYSTQGDFYNQYGYDRYQYMDGTSMASPHIAGMLALAKAQFSWESASELIDRVRFSADAVGAFSSISQSGGRANVASAFGARPAVINGSGRCFVGTGSQIAIGGIWIGGPNSKRVAFRAWGPSLGQWLSPALPDPQITIYNSSGQQVGIPNDNWGSLSQADRDELAAHGMTPLHALDSAWVGTLAPGGYTVHLSGVGGSTGIALLECWDFDNSTVSRLINASMRSYVGTGNAITIGGFTVSGNRPRQLFIRALGPTLGTWGVPGALQDTVITLYDGGGNQIASNDDWRGFDGSSTSLETRLAQLGYPPFDNRESAIVIRLNAGAYTVHLTGKNGATGVGLIDVFEY